ncbi:MAG: hypothetical protein A2583_12495 [Bdellovibrionales bacterium RIFOXYD1_FULL_53_11]|nr:MAG: hypothetical protein A2583_12495 [Bdellovibrionales bacterium RIFOXYD1_FULL_53_11]
MNANRAGGRVTLFFDDALLESKIRGILTDAGYEVVRVDNGDALVDAALTGGAGTIVSETVLVTGAGNPLLRHIYKLAPEQPIVLVSDFARLAEFKDAADAGCQRFVPKPVAASELLDAVKESKSQDSESVEINESNYARVGIEEFIYGKSYQYSLFARLRNGKFIKVAHVGQNIDLDQMEKFKARGISELWLERKDFTDHMERSRLLAREAVSSHDLPEGKRASVITRACEAASENLRLMGVSENSLEPAKETLTAAISSVGSGQLALALLEKMESRGSVSYARAVTCGIICGLIGRIMGWMLEKNVLALALGGYLHDIGLNTLPVDAQEKQLEELSVEEADAYKGHPQRGAEELAKIPGIPKDVIAIVEQHHENCAGTGYPKGLSGSEIFPMARIVHLVDSFCVHMLRMDPSMRVRAPDVLVDMETENPGYFDGTAMMALRLLLSQPDLKNAAAAYSLELSRMRPEGR